MPTLAHTLINDADPTAPLLILGPSLGTHGSQWAGVAYRLADDYRVVTVDLPGHGQSQRMPNVTIDDLADEIVAIADSYGAKTFGFAGVSISGAIALTLALRAPDRPARKSPRCAPEPSSGEQSAGMRGSARCARPEVSARSSWTRPVAGSPRRASSMRTTSSGPIVLEQLAQTDPEGYIDCCGALARYDIRSRVGEITTPVLFLAGSQDPGNTPEAMRELHEQVDGSRFAVVPDSAHLPLVEHPDLVSDHLMEFFASSDDSTPVLAAFVLTLDLTPAAART